MAALDSYMERKSAAIAARIADYTTQPERAVVTLRAVSQVAGISGARPTRMGDFLIVSDSGPGLAGFALGPTAPELLLGALASCLVHTYLIHAARLHIPLDSLEIAVSGALNYAGVVGMDVGEPPQLQAITYQTDLHSPAPPADIERLHAAVDAHCPVMNTLRLPIAVTRTGE